MTIFISKTLKPKLRIFKVLSLVHWNYTSTFWRTARGRTEVLFDIHVEGLSIQGIHLWPSQFLGSNLRAAWCPPLWWTRHNCTLDLQFAVLGKPVPAFMTDSALQQQVFIIQDAINDQWFMSYSIYEAHQLRMVFKILEVSSKLFKLLDKRTSACIVMIV